MPAMPSAQSNPSSTAPNPSATPPSASQAWTTRTGARHSIQASVAAATAHPTANSASASANSPVERAAPSGMSRAPVASSAAAVA